MSNLLQQHFLQNIAERGENAAIEVEGECLSYASFYKRIQALMLLLQRNAIQHKAIIVLNDQSLHSYAGILAVNFTGNVFVPVETSWPRQRILDILELVKPAGIIISLADDDSISLLEKVPELEALHVINSINDENTSITKQPIKALDYEGLAYIIFTSGSTGKPKGVPVSLENVNAFITNIKADYSFHPNDRFLQVYDITFDVTYFSFFIPFCFGACCCVLEQQKGVPKFLSIVNDLIKKGITVVSMVPTVINLSKKFIKKEKALAVKYSFFIGDVLLHSDALAWQQFTPNGEIHNHYGPTEATIACSKYRWHKDDSLDEIMFDAVPIGKLFKTLDFKIIDKASNSNNIEVGELAICGDQVVTHYLGNEQQEQFLEVKEDTGKRMVFYKTGDLVSITDKGNLRFHGRVDHQVKLNGFRIELNEVQLAITKITNRKCVVIKKKNAFNTHFLSAYIEGTPLENEDLSKQLRVLLPTYMIPGEFHYLPSLPLTENGKINRLYLQSL